MSEFLTALAALFVAIPSTTPSERAAQLESDIDQLDEERRRRVDEIRVLAGLDADLDKVMR